MIKANHKIIVCLVLLACNFNCIAQSSKKAKGSGYRFNFGPVIGFYNINSKHATYSNAKMSAVIGFKKEIRLDNQFQNYFLFGIDYFFHGLNFKSYYFKPDSLQLYDKNFSYKYSLFIQEFNVPLQVKHSFTRENNSLFSPYVIFGYHLRYLLSSKVNVSQDGNIILTDWSEMTFKHKIISNKINCFVSAGFGFQKNKINATSMGFFVEANYRYGFSQYLFQRDYSASSLYMNGSHLCILMGINF